MRTTSGVVLDAAEQKESPTQTQSTRSDRKTTWYRLTLSTDLEVAQAVHDLSVHRGATISTLLRDGLALLAKEQLPGAPATLQSALVTLIAAANDAPNYSRQRLRRRPGRPSPVMEG